MDYYNRKTTTNLEKRLINEVALLRYQLELLKQQSQVDISEVEQTSKLLERKPQPLLLGRYYGR